VGLNEVNKSMQRRGKVLYAFYDCEDCARGFSIEETPDDPIEEPCCPCGSSFARFVGLVEMPIPLPIITRIVKDDAPEDKNQAAIDDYIGQGGERP